MKKIRDDRYEKKKSQAYSAAAEKRARFFALKLSDIIVNYTFNVKLNKIIRWFPDYCKHLRWIWVILNEAEAYICVLQ